MFPQIGDLINYLFGTQFNIPIQSYGFCVAMAFLAAVWVLKLELKRKEKSGLMPAVEKKVLRGKPAGVFELLTMGVFGFVIGFKVLGIILNYQEFSSTPQSYLFSLHGNLAGGIALAVLFSAYRFYEKYRKRLSEPVWEDTLVHPYQQSGSILIVAAITGVIGAKIFHNLENFDDFLRDPVNSLFSLMGLTFYGGLIVAAFSVGFYAKRQKMSIIQIMDATAPAIILAYGIGRIGCMLSGDGCWGVENLNPKPEWLAFLPDWMWAFDFPHNVVGDGVPIDHCTGKYCTILEHPVYPTSFYDSLLSFVGFGLLWAIRKRNKIYGSQFSIMIFYVAIQRYFMEKIRVNNEYHFWGMNITQAEIISVVLLLFALGSFWYFYRYKKKNIQIP